MKLVGSGKNFNLKTAEDNGTGYRFGYNGKEQDFSLHNADGEVYDYESRMYDPRVCRWFSPDGKEHNTPGISPYSFAFDNPILFMDPNGDDARLSINYETGTIMIETTIHLYGKNASQELAAQMNSAFDAMAPTPRKFIDENGKEWTVSICITYSAVNKNAIDKQLEGMGKNNLQKANVAEATDLKTDQLQGFEDGDNIMEIDYSKDWANAKGFVGGSGKSGSVIGKGASANTQMHEPLHLMGFGDLPEGVSKVKDVMEGAGSPNADVQIGAFHYVDIMNFAKQQSPTSTTIIFGEFKQLNLNENGGIPYGYGTVKSVKDANKKAEAMEVKQTTVQ